MGQDGTFPEGCVNFLAVSVLVLLVGAMLALPLVPSLIELRNKSDAQPLRVIQEHAGEIRHFANGFRIYIAGLHESLQQCILTRKTARGVLSDGCEYLILGKPAEADELPIKEKQASCEVVLVAGAELSPPDGVTFSKEIYAAEKFSGGAGNTYRAILGERGVRLGQGTRVMRWVHAMGPISAETGCELYGRISSDCAIILSSDTRFLRLNAPRIEFGPVPHDRRAFSDEHIFPSNDSRIVHRLLCDGDFEIGEDEIISGSVVARGRLLIRKGGRVRGSAKSHHEMILEQGAVVEGSLISASKMRIGNECAVHGPIIAEREITIAAGTYCGSLSQPTTISTPQVKVEEGVVVYGTVWARESGRVVAQL